MTSSIGLLTSLAAGPGSRAALDDARPTQPFFSPSGLATSVRGAAARSARPSRCRSACRGHDMRRGAFLAYRCDGLLSALYSNALSRTRVDVLTADRR